MKLIQKLNKYICINKKETIHKSQLKNIIHKINLKIIVMKVPITEINTLRESMNKLEENPDYKK